MLTKIIQSLNDNIDKLGNNKRLINQINIGLERETLRINRNSGHLSNQPHPIAIGSALTNPNITTDFAEMMLEFVTAPHDSAEEALNALTKIQDFTLLQLDDEIFWPNSMPPAISSENEIQIAQYGESNQAKMKRLYRHGLSLRYGKMMQAISGIHYNFSLKEVFFEAFQKAIESTTTLKDFKTERYLHLCRNIVRFGYIVPYFIGASPIMCKSFLDQAYNKFPSFNEEDSYVENGTSLRLSDIGYGNNKCHFDVSYNNINTFINNIYYAITTPCKDFSKIPLKINGEYQQINSHILQIENEYYSSIRPKQVLNSGQNFLEALKNNGIEYVELRSIDVNPYFKEGIDLETMKFLQALLTTCLLSDSPPLSQTEYEQAQKNMKLVAEKGRLPDLELLIMGENIIVKDALSSVLDWMQPVCEILGDDFLQILDNKRKLIDSPDLIPAAKIINDLKESKLTYQQFFLQKAQKHYLRNRSSLTDDEINAFKQQANNSVIKQQEIESQPQIPFDQFLEDYFKINI